MVFHRNPNLSDEWDLERLRFLPPDEDLERLRFCLPSGEEEGERDLFWGEEPFPDLELDLLGGGDKPSTEVSTVDTGAPHQFIPANF